MGEAPKCTRGAQPDKQTAVQAGMAAWHSTAQHSTAHLPGAADLARHTSEQKNAAACCATRQAQHRTAPRSAELPTCPALPIWPTTEAREMMRPFFFLPITLAAACTCRMTPASQHVEQTCMCYPQPIQCTQRHPAALIPAANPPWRHTTRPKLHNLLPSTCSHIHLLPPTTAHLGGVEHARQVDIDHRLHSYGRAGVRLCRLPHASLHASCRHLRR